MEIVVLSRLLITVAALLRKKFLKWVMKIRLTTRIRLIS
nr:MAG TPA: hypothetical protein [Crassvirales sp.]DAM09947.1 MAG TPA: hypothetical protein [Caudoviricetes sp.]